MNDLAVINAPVSMISSPLIDEKLKSHEMDWAIRVVREKLSCKEAWVKVYGERSTPEATRKSAERGSKKLLENPHVLDYMGLLRTTIEPDAKVLTVQRRREILNDIAENAKSDMDKIRAIIEDAKLAGEHAPTLEKKDVTITVKKVWE